MKRIIYIFILISFLSKANTPSIIFKENKGQWPEKVLFGTEIYNTKFYVNKNSFNYCIYNPEEYVKQFGRHKSNEKPSVIHGHNYEVNFVGADLTKISKKEEQTEYYNYFLGKDKSKWASNIKAFGNILFNEIYNGVDLKLYSSNINLKYDFIVKPNANVNSIQLNFNYTDGIEIMNDELIIKTSVGNIIEKAPFAYQIINGIKKLVQCKYTLLNKNTIGFIFPEGYDKNYELVIDPTVVVCSYSGATNYAAGDVSTYDANGNIFVSAEANIGYPTTPGAFQVNGHYLTVNDYIDIVISKYNSIGSLKYFSTYIGGDDSDFALDMNVGKNEITIYGGTLSGNYPVTPTAYDTIMNTPGINYDIVVSKLNLTGTALLGSTYFGGINNEIMNLFTNNSWGWNSAEMICDSAGNVFLIGSTNSADLPVTPGVISGTMQGNNDAFIAKFNSSLTKLKWSTFLGGSAGENGVSIKYDGKGGLYCFGSTSSTNFPVTPGAYNATKNGTGTTIDLYVTHIDSIGKNILASTYLGTTQQDYASLMDIDMNGDIYLSGGNSVPSLLIPTSGCYNNTNGYNFIYKLNSSLSNLIYKTKFGYYVPGPFPGTSPYLAETAFKVDSCGKIYIAGFAENTLPTTPNAFQSFAGGVTDMYFAVFNQNCSSLAFGSFFGGNKINNWSTIPANNVGECSGLGHFDKRGYLYSAVDVPGGLPVTPGAYATTWVNTSTLVSCNDAFVKVDMGTFINASSYGANVTGCPPFSTHFVSTTNTGTSFWDLGDGTTTNLDTITHTYNNLGTYNVLLVVTDTNTCNRTDSIKSILNVINPTTFDLGEDVSTCITIPALLQSPVTAITYSWSNGQTTSTISALPGTYTLTINNGGCNSSDFVNVIIGEKKLSERFPNVITPNGDQVNDFIDFTKYNFDEVEFYLYDRWGRERFKITNPTEIWQPNNLDNGTYFWVVNYKSSCIGKYATDKGFITIFK